MKREEIIDVFHKRLKKIKKCYSLVVQDFDIDAIHDFRVEIKKLRAFIRLLNTETANHQIKIPGRIKEFYGATGEIRNLQLHEQKLVSFCSERQLDLPGHYLSVLDVLGKKEKEKAKRVGDRISFNHFEKSLIQAAPLTLSDESVQYFVLQKQRALQRLLQDTSDETLHEIRKILKDFLYNWGFISTYVSFFLPQYFTDSKNIDSMTTMLGDFHDVCVAISFFNSSLTEMKNEGVEKEQCELIKKEFEDNKAHLKDEILLSLQGLAIMPML